MDKLEKILETDIKDCVLLLRDYGFNTFCSCGHKPSPYIQMECYCDSDITKLCNLLMENNYKNFGIRFFWDTVINTKCLEVIFNLGNIEMRKDDTGTPV